jgi:hypothetical protein
MVVVVEAIEGIVEVLEALVVHFVKAESCTLPGLHVGLSARHLVEKHLPSIVDNSK